MRIQDDESLDDLLHGELKLLQKKRGYRYSVDALLLASFALPLASSGTLLDMGAGSGVIALILAQRGTPSRVVAVELQPVLAEMARRNAELNRTEPRVEVIEADAVRLHERLPGLKFDLIVSNPPFRPRGSGRASLHPEKALARHELGMDLPSWLREAVRLLAPGGSLCLVYPVDQEDRLLREALAAGLHPVRKQYAVDRPGGSRKLLLVELRARPGRLRVLPELAIETEEGKFSLDGYR